MIGHVRRLAHSFDGSSLKARLARGAAAAFVINVAGAGLGFAVHLVLARVLGIEGYGVYAYVFAWVNLLGTLGTLGFQNTVLRFVGAYRAQEQWGRLRALLRYVAQRVVLASVALAVLGAIVVAVQSDHLDPSLARTFFVGLAAIPALALMKTQAWVVRGLGRVVSALAPIMLLRHLVVLATVGLVAVAFRGTLSAGLAMASTLLGMLAALGALALAFRRARPAAVRTAPYEDESGEWRRSAQALFLVASVQMVFNQAGVLMLGWLSGTDTAGIFAVVVRIADLALFPLAAVNMVFAPTISALYVREEKVSLQGMVTTTTWWIMLSSAVLALPLIILADWVLALYGEGFAAGATALRVMLASHLIAAAAGPVNYILSMTGHERPTAVLSMVSATFLLGANLVLIPVLGIEGAAIGYLLALTGSKLMAMILIWRWIGIVPSLFGGRFASAG
jgi:O-antigen/teichoic acid export membrane protein